jgi:tape measure domain-containing protein
MHLMASLGMDTSDYEQSIEEAKEQTKSSVASMTKDYNRLYSDVLHLTAAYQKSSKETGENSKATKDLKQKLSDAQKQLDATAKGLNTAQQYMDSSSKKTDNAGNSLAAAMTKAQLLASAVQNAARKIKDLAVGFVQTGMQYNAQIETYRTALTNMLGDAEKANAMLTSIKRDAARTPFSTDALVAANQYLLSAGENAEYSQKTILALGDAIKATGGGDDELNRMAQNLQQVANVGKASAVDIKQFAFAGINIYQVLADYTGKSVQEVQSMTVTYDVLTKALQAAAQEGGRYYNSMATQSQTLEGRTTTLTDNVKQLAGELTTGLSSAYGSIVEKANSWVSSILESDEKLSQLETTVTVAASAVAGLTAAFVAYKAAMAIANIITAVQKATEGLTAAQVALNIAMDSNPIGIVAAALGVLVGAIGAAYAANEQFREAWNSAWKSIKNGFSVAADFILDKLNRIMGVANGVANAIAAIGRGENPLDAYNAAYAQTRQQYKDQPKQSNRDRLRQNALSGKSVSNKSWSERQAEAAATSGSGGSSIVTSPSGKTGNPPKTGKTPKSTSKTETVISSVTHTATTTAQNALGAVTTSVETLQEKVKDAAGKIKDRVTETTTETGKEMVNGVATTYTLVTKKVTDANGKISTTTKKVYADMSKTLLGTLTIIAEKTFNGITTTTQQAVETYADGSQHIKTTATETGERIVDGVRQTYTKVISYIDGVQDKVTETAQAIDKSIKATQKRIEENLSKAQQQFNSGIFKLGKNLYTDLKNQDWAALGLDIVNMMWGEVSQEQREVLSDWANKALEAINEAYSGGGLSEAFNAFKQIMSNGIKAEADGVTTDVKGLSKVFQDLGINVSDVGSKIMGVLGTMGTGIGTFVSNAGTGIAKLAGSMGSLGTIAKGAGGLIAKIGGLIISNPEVAAIIAIVAGVVALGAALFAKFGKSSGGGQAVSHYESPFAGHDVYDSLTEFSTRAAMQHRYIEKTTGTDAQLGILQQIRDMLDEHLPDIGTGQLVMDGEKVADMLTPRLATNMDTSMGVYTLRAERGV